MPIDEKQIGELAEEYQVTSEDLDTETPEEPLYDPETSPEVTPEVTPDEEWSVNPQWGKENIEEVNEIMTEGKVPAEVDQSGCFIGSVMSCSPQEVKTKLEKGEIDEEEATDYYLKKAIEKDLFKMEPNEIKMAHMRGLIDDETALKYINYKKHPVGYTIADMAKGIGYGVRNAAYEFNQALVSLYNWATGDDFDPTKSTGIMGSIFYTGTEEDAQAETTVGGITSTLSQFGVGFVPSLKGVQALKAIPTLARMAKAAPRAYKIVEAAVAGAPVDTLLFDPKEPRLADFLSKYEVLRNPVFEYLKSSPDDTESEARLKNMIEGMGMGVMFDGLFLGLKVIKGKLWAKHANRADKVAEELHRNIPDDLQGKPPKKEESFVLEDLGEQRVDIEAPKELPMQVKASEMSEAKQIVAIAKGLADGKDVTKHFNIDKYETLDQVKKIVVKMSDDYLKEQVRPLATTQRLAALVGGSQDDLIEGMKKLHGEVKNLDVMIKAYHDFFIAYEESLYKMAKEATTDADYIKVVAHMQQANEIMQLMKGIQRGTARGLNAHKLMRSAKKFDFDKIPNLEDEIDVRARKNIKKVVDNYKSEKDRAVRTLYSRNFSRNRITQGMVELRQASLVANPGTWAVNVIGNAGAQTFEIVNRMIMTGGASAVNPARAKQFGAMLHGLMAGFADSFRLKADMKAGKEVGKVWQVARHGDPVLDPRTKYADSGQVFESALGRMSFITQIGFRPLTVMDEFFKTMGYHFEKHYRAADMVISKAGKFDKKAYQDMITEIPEELHQLSLRFARETTFQLPMTYRLRSLKGAIDIWPVRLLFLPFYNVAVNINRFALERTPLGLASKTIREELKAGGMRAAEAAGRMTMGTGLAALGAWMYEQGMFFGSFEKSQRPAMDNAGIQQFSLIVPDGEGGRKSVSLNRLDPIVTWLGMGADIARMVNTMQLGEKDVDRLSSMFITATAELITDKSFLKGVHDLVAIAFGERKWTSFANRTAGSFLPFSTGVQWAKGQFFEDTRRQIYTFMDGLKKNYQQGKLLPKRHAITGEKVENIPRSWGMFNVTEVAQGPNRAILDMAANGAAMRPMKQEIGGVELTGAEYDRVNQLLESLPVRETLNALYDNPMFSQGKSAEEKAKIYRRVVNNFRKAARQMFLAESPEKMREIAKEAITRGQAIQGLITQDDPESQFLRLMIDRGVF